MPHGQKGPQRCSYVIAIFRGTVLTGQRRCWETNMDVKYHPHWEGFLCESHTEQVDKEVAEAKRRHPARGAGRPKLHVIQEAR